MTGSRQVLQSLMEELEANQRSTAVRALRRQCDTVPIEQYRQGYEAALDEVIRILEQLHTSYGPFTPEQIIQIVHDISNRIPFTEVMTTPKSHDYIPGEGWRKKR